MVAEQRKQDERRGFIFTYGTLKRGFSNHTLMQELIRTGDATFIGTVRTAENYPLVCGPYRVPFLLDIPGCGQRVHGELYAVSFKGLARMDELEGTSRGHYERLPILLELERRDDADGGICGGFGMPCGAEGLTGAEAYYAHRSYAMELWMKNGKKGLSAYTERETKGYVKRKDRPQHLTFLDHIQHFLSSSPSN